MSADRSTGPAHVPTLSSLRTPCRAPVYASYDAPRSSTMMSFDVGHGVAVGRFRPRLNPDHHFVSPNVLRLLTDVPVAWS